MYVKIYSGILESSIASDTKLRRFFMDLLLIADQDGCVVATRNAIAKRIGVDLSEVDWGIEKLLQPDEESGNPENEGRRIEPMEGRGYGWRILNYGFYRDIKTASELRAANARRQAEFRDRKKAQDEASNAALLLRNKNNPSEAEEDSEELKALSPIGDGPLPEQASTRSRVRSSTPEKNGLVEGGSTRNRARQPKHAMPEDFGISERVKSWAIEKGHTRLADHLEAFKAKCKANGYAYADWDSAFMEAIRGDWAKLGNPRLSTASNGGNSPAASRPL